jgi:hypothetical protein
MKTIKAKDLLKQKPSSQISKKKKIEKGFFEIIFQNEKYSKIIYKGISEGMNYFISSHHSKYLNYKIKIHNEAKLLKSIGKQKYNIYDNSYIIIKGYRKSNRILDYDNFVSGIKPFIDTFHKDFKIIKDDDYKHLKIKYFQEITKDENQIEFYIYNLNYLNQFNKITQDLYKINEINNEFELLLIFNNYIKIELKENYYINLNNINLILLEENNLIFKDKLNNIKFKLKIDKTNEKYLLHLFQNYYYKNKIFIKILNYQ